MGADVELLAKDVDSTFLRHHAKYEELRNLAEDSRAEYDDLVRQHAEKAEVNADEDNIEAAVIVPRTTGILPNLPPDATWEKQAVYERPSELIRAMVAAFPDEEQLTFDQVMFVAEFANACDCVFENVKKLPKDRRVHHILLLGQGGFGKTHVMQNLVFDVVGFIWPPKALGEPTMHVVAFSNAQAKNISTKHLKARTIHNACCMRMQKLENPRMRPRNKQKASTTLWDRCIVYVIEEINMVSAPMYNTLNFRYMYGRSKTHEVHGHNYAQPGNHSEESPLSFPWVIFCN